MVKIDVSYVLSVILPNALSFFITSICIEQFFVNFLRKEIVLHFNGALRIHDGTKGIHPRLKNIVGLAILKLPDRQLFDKYRKLPMNSL